MRRCLKGSLAASTVVALLVAQACAPPTQARVRIRSTLLCAQLNGVNIVVGPSPETTEQRVRDGAVNSQINTREGGCTDVPGGGRPGHRRAGPRFRPRGHCRGCRHQRPSRGEGSRRGPVWPTRGIRRGRLQRLHCGAEALFVRGPQDTRVHHRARVVLHRQALRLCQRDLLRGCLRHRRAVLPKRNLRGTQRGARRRHRDRTDAHRRGHAHGCRAPGCHRGCRNGRCPRTVDAMRARVPQRRRWRQQGLLRPRQRVLRLWHVVQARGQVRARRGQLRFHRKPEVRATMLHETLWSRAALRRDSGPDSKRGRGTAYPLRTPRRARPGVHHHGHLRIGRRLQDRPPLPPAARRESRGHRVSLVEPGWCPQTTKGCASRSPHTLCQCIAALMRET
jgi:hypothetical protein